ncbi:MAG: MBL fold metallo-hydrolase [Acidobacteria bacterium]|nr:MBL fold metallo-hydrolase [Acidobacteriota bacterium]
MDRSDSLGTSVEFFGGIEVIGSSKIMVSTAHARVLLDMGLDIPGETDLFRAPVAERVGSELQDRLAVGFAPRMTGIYDPAQLAYGSPLAEPDARPTAIFLSHSHIDHDGALGFARKDLPVYAHPDTVRLQEAIAVSETGSVGHPLAVLPMSAPVTVGDITVTLVPVNHDVPGASAFIVETPDGTLAYTGDINFHRDGGTLSAEFVRRAAGVTMLVTETTMLSFPERSAAEGAEHFEPRSEDDVIRLAGEAMGAAPGLALLSMYVRDVDRAERLIQEATARGRTLVWPGQQAALLHHFGVSNVATWAADTPQRPVNVRALDAVLDLVPDLPRRVTLAEVRESPSLFVIQPDVADVPSLLDLPVQAPHRPEGQWLPFIHAQGEPLGPFMANWQPYMDWLAELGITLVSVGSSGHATGAALHQMVADINPAVVVPIHGFRPEALVVQGARLLPEYGKRYALDGTELTNM